MSSLKYVYSTPYLSKLVSFCFFLTDSAAAGDTNPHLFIFVNFCFSLTIFSCDVCSTPCFIIVFSLLVFSTCGLVWLEAHFLLQNSLYPLSNPRNLQLVLLHSLHKDIFLILLIQL